MGMYLFLKSIHLYQYISTLNVEEALVWQLSQAVSLDDTENVYLAPICRKAVPEYQFLFTFSRLQINHPRMFCYMQHGIHAATQT